MDLVLENITRILPSLDPRERRAECGRLILAADALHYVQGWEVHQQNVGGGGDLGGMLLDLLHSAPELVDTRHEGARLLAEVASLGPAEQVRAIAGSVSVHRADVGSAKLGFFIGALKVVTAARGEVYVFNIPRRHRPAVNAWIAALALG